MQLSYVSGYGPESACLVVQRKEEKEEKDKEENEEKDKDENEKKEKKEDKRTQ